jgi:hypothetical protein
MYHVVVFVEEVDQAPRILACEKPEELTALVRQHVLEATKPGWAFAFGPEGRIKISTPQASGHIKLADKDVPVGVTEIAYDDGGRFEPLHPVTPE